MPYKFNADRRDKITKQKHRVTNWSAYNEGLTTADAAKDALIANPQRPFLLGGLI